MTSFRDILLVSVILFTIGLIIVLLIPIGHTINAKFLNMTPFNESAQATTTLQKADTAMNMTDYMFLAGLIGYFIGIIVIGYLVGGNPIFTPIYFFLVVIITFVAVILQNIWGDIFLISPTTVLPIIVFILNHLGYFTAIFGLVGIIVTFAKPEGG